ncbi:MAG TPA: outer membrane protein assembly factor BamE [Candidatus Aminicenantes bacterium]|nr:outer membrane protein assembly factor BamE [Candidatus Aminicenantes bacterium]HRY64618.1 outer membrane protein assembly factor BamE [Candidatus Aminicenantes bacterium]HRZ71531.1 outer membrane protein assembly factor BamE [Candidatus Aminicenantes bacterium]
MAKDWRIPFCTRYRPLATLILVFLVWALAIIAFLAIAGAIHHNQTERWKAKLAQVKPGMTRGELIRILGEPQLKDRIASNKGYWLLSENPKEEEKFKAEHKELVEYYYDEAFSFATHAFRYVVYLDENEERVLSKPRIGSLFGFDSSGLARVVFLSLAVLAVPVWIAVRSWCRKKLRETPDARPEI